MKKLIGLTLLTLAGMGVIAADAGLVASPRRAVEKTWENKAIKGRDYWQILERDVRQMPGVDNEEFVKQSALKFNAQNVSQPGFESRDRMRRTLALRELTLFAADTERNIAAEAGITVTVAPDVRYYYPEALNDGNVNSVFVARGDLGNAETRYQGVAATISATFPTPRAIAKAMFYHGVRDDGRLERVTMEIERDGQWFPVPAKMENDKDVLTLAPERPITAAAFRFQCVSRPMTVALLTDWLGNPKLLKEFPFEIWPPFRPTYRNFFGLKASNFDAPGFRRFLAEYDAEFMGFCLPEWDSNISVVKRWKDTTADVDRYLPPYKTREEALKSWQRYFDYQKDLFFGQVSAMSGVMATSLYAAAWGAKTVGLEHTAMNTICPVRGTLMFLRGGARQFDRYWLHYIAYFALMYSPTPEQPEIGKSPAQSRRELFTSYYMGATFQEFEGDFHALFARPRGAKTYALSPNGETVKELYEWSKSEKGRRGASYTPFLFLIDYKTGYNGTKHDQNEWRVWNEIPFNDGDYMIDAFVYTVDKIPLPAYRAQDGRGYGDFIRPPYSNNIYNSAVGDLVDVFFANPPQHNNAVKAEQLEKYAVVFLLGEIDVNPTLAERLKTYVEEGGTLVINAAQKLGALNDPSFTGVVVGDKRETINVPAEFVAGSGTVRERDCPMEAIVVEPRGAEVVERAESGLPLSLKHRFGEGSVLTTTPAYMLMGDKKQINPLIERLLVRLQKEVLPMAVEGDCQFLVNVLDDDHFRVTLINNKGVIKHPAGGQEIRVPTYAANINVVVSKDAVVNEILTNAPPRRSARGDKAVYTVALPPGEIRVIDINER